jgi:hypothetical protein
MAESEACLECGKCRYVGVGVSSAGSNALLNPVTKKCEDAPVHEVAGES